MGNSQSRPSQPPSALAKPGQPLPERKIARRVLTKEVAERFAEELLSDVSHSVDSAARKIGIKPAVVRQALKRARDDTAFSLEDEEICDILAAAKEEHIKTIRRYGFYSAGTGNRAGVAWIQWQSEVQDPLNHPRKQEVAPPSMGDAGDPGGAMARVVYVDVPADEREDDDP